MSWNVYLMRASGFSSVREIPEGWSPPPLGPPDTVLARLRAALPGLHLSRPGLASLHSEDCSLHFHLGTLPQTPGIQLIASGDTQALLDALGRVCSALDVRALAVDLGDFLRLDEDPDTGRHVWRNAPDPGLLAPA